MSFFVTHGPRSELKLKGMLIKTPCEDQELRLLRDSGCGWVFDLPLLGSHEIDHTRTHSHTQICICICICIQKRRLWRLRFGNPLFSVVLCVSKGCAWVSVSVGRSFGAHACMFLLPTTTSALDCSKPGGLFINFVV